MRKNTIIISAAALLVLAFAATAMAGPGHGRGMGRGFGSCWSNSGAVNQLTPEQQQKYAAIMDDYANKVRPLQQQMWTVHTELRVLAQNPNTKPEDLTSRVQTLSKLREQMFDARKALSDRLEKELGIKGFGYGPGNCGGPGMGRGMMGGGMGYGPGNCPGLAPDAPDAPEEAPAN